MILHLIETGGPGGAEQMLLRLADEYGRRGFAQAVCLRKNGWLAEEVRRRDLLLEIVPLTRLPDIRWFKKLIKFARENKVKAIHAHEFAMNVRGAILGSSLKIPIVATIHGKGYFSDKWSRRQAYRLTSRMASFVAVSNDIRKQLIHKTGLNPHRVSVIPNGVDIEHFQFNIEKRKVFRELYKVNDKQILLGTVGSYYPVKGQRYLIEAMKKIVAINHCVKLVMAGQGPLGVELDRQIYDNGLKEYVQLVDYVNDIPGFLSALDIFILPSLSEGLPLSLLEAAACKLCIVATHVGGIPEFIVDQENGVLVPPKDSEALAEAVIELFDPNKRFSLANNVFSTLKRDWSLYRIADQYLKLLLPNIYSLV